MTTNSRVILACLLILVVALAQPLAAMASEAVPAAFTSPLAAVLIAENPEPLNNSDAKNDHIEITDENDSDEPVSEPDSDVVASPNLQFSELAVRICPDAAVKCTSNDGKPLAFIELYNSSSTDFAESGWTVQYAAANATTGEPGKWSTAFPLSVIVAQTYQSFSYAVSNMSGGYLRIVDAAGSVTDQLAYGTASKADETATAAPGYNQSIQRCELIDQQLFSEDPTQMWQVYDLPTRDVGLPCPAIEPSDPDATGSVDSGDPGDSAGNDNDNSTLFEEPDQTPVNACQNLRINEIGANLDQPFIEITNIDASSHGLQNCHIMTNRSTTKFYALPDMVLSAGGLYVVYLADTNLALTKTTKGTVYLLSSDGKNEVDAVSYANLKSGTSWAKFAADWAQTYQPTPGQPNQTQPDLPCADGYYRNPETGRCNKIPVETALAECPAGQYRNPDTGRCKKYETATTLAECPEGYYRNPATNRCKKIEQPNEPTPCAEGWERNPETGRCRKIVDEQPAAFGLIQPPDDGGDNWWIWGAGAVVGLTGMSVAWQYKAEMKRFTQKLFSRLRRRQGGRQRIATEVSE
jgi:hypothetical protein